MVKQHLPFKAHRLAYGYGTAKIPKKNTLGNEALGRLGIGGGAYTTTKIPFTRSILVTAYMSDNTAQTIRDMNNGVKYSGSEGESKTLYSLIRGLENYGPMSCVIQYSAFK